MKAQEWSRRWRDKRWETCTCASLMAAQPGPLLLDRTLTGPVLKSVLARASSRFLNKRDRRGSAVWPPAPHLGFEVSGSSVLL